MRVLALEPALRVAAFLVVLVACFLFACDSFVIKTAFSIAGSWIDRLTGKTKKEINEMRNASVKLTQDMARSMGQTVQAGVSSFV